MFKVNNKDTRTTSLTSLTGEGWEGWGGGGLLLLLVNFEHISPLFLVLLLLTLNNSMICDTYICVSEGKKC